MTIKYFAAVALLGMTLSGAAHAQSWERWDEGGAQAYQEGATLTFGCDSDDGSAASLRAVVGFDRGDRAAMASMSSGRQYSGLFVVDRLFDRAELRLGDRRPQVVRLVRLAGAGR